MNGASDLLKKPRADILGGERIREGIRHKAQRKGGAKTRYKLDLGQEIRKAVRTWRGARSREDGEDSNER